MHEALRTNRGHATSALDCPAPDFPRIAFLHDYVRLPFAAGSAFAAQLMHSELRRRGHDVTIVGPRDPEAARRPEQLPEKFVAFPGIPMRNQPGLFLPLPERAPLQALAEQNFDIVVGQTGSALMEAGMWLRNAHGVPLLCVNTTLLAWVYDTLLPDALHNNKLVRRLCEKFLVPFAERLSVEGYNRSDGLVVLSEGVGDYWRELGVRVPIHVIPRSIDPRICNASSGSDPFDPRAVAGGRLLVVCRHVREKGVARLLDIFARHVAPDAPHATLTLVGDGADHGTFMAHAERLGVADKTFFVGELPVSKVRPWYDHADLFVYASLSETYGQVVSEAMWCGLPVVAFDDHAGVAHQITSGRDSMLLPTGPDTAAADEAFGAEVRDLLARPERRRRLAEAAHRSAASRIDPQRCVEGYYEAFEEARRHHAKNAGKSSWWFGAQSIARWTMVQALAGALGALRSVVLNRNESQQPGWSDPTLSSPATAEPRSSDAAA